MYNKIRDIHWMDIFKYFTLTVYFFATKMLGYWVYLVILKFLKNFDIFEILKKNYIYYYSIKIIGPIIF